MPSGSPTLEPTFICDKQNAEWPRLETRRWRRQKTESMQSEETMSLVKTSTSSVDVPSVGSIDHLIGDCKPCVFLHTKGCKSGTECKFCHVCGPDEKKNRQKAKRMQLQQLRGEHRRQSDVVCPYSVIVTPSQDSGTATKLSKGDALHSGEHPFAHVAGASRPTYKTPRPSLLQLPDEHLEAPYVVRNTFIEAPSGTPSSLGSDFGGRAIASCPASKIGEMQFEKQTQCDDADTLYMSDWTSLTLGSPLSLSSMSWPATPEPEGLSEQTFTHQTFFPATVLHSNLDGHVPTASASTSVRSELVVLSDMRYTVRNTFVDTSSAIHTMLGSDSCGRAISSCPASNIGTMQLTEASWLDDLDMRSVDVLASFESESPEAMLGTLWPVTPEPAALYGHWLPLSFVEPPAEPEARATLQDPLQEMAFTLAPPAVESDCQSSTSGSRILSLAEMIGNDNRTKPECGYSSLEVLSSVGSVLHCLGTCKPCGFFHKNGCAAGHQCDFCHLCDSGEKKRRQREKRETFRDSGRISGFVVAAGGA